MAIETANKKFLEAMLLLSEARELWEMNQQHAKAQTSTNLKTKGSWDIHNPSVNAMKAKLEAHLFIMLHTFLG